ncbi:MAG TPA: hypothetical protein VKW76_06885 [Candidatus Binatia bacterium]|nr:hypothetical protein [Candidatus Binatia bacterium]
MRAGSDPHSTRVELRYAVDRPPVVTIRRYRRTAAGWEERSYLALRNTELLPVVTALVTALDRMREHERRQRLHPEDVARFIATRRPRQDAPPLPQFARGAPPGAG